MNKFKKLIYLLVGLIAFILGAIGIFLPLLPTTPLFLLTSFCLLKSNDKLKEKGGMTLKAKLCLTVPVSFLLLFMFITIDSPVMKTIVVIMWLAKVIVFTKMKTIKVETKMEGYDG